MGLILLDSAVIVGFLDGDDALHEVCVTKLKESARSGPFVASIVSYAEVMTGAALGHHPSERVDGFFDSLIRELLTIDRSTAARAAILRGTYPALKLPDALILASADLHDDVDAVLAADVAWRTVRGLSFRVELLRPTSGSGRPLPHSPRASRRRSARP